MEIWLVVEIIKSIEGNPKLICRLAEMGLIQGETFIRIQHNILKIRNGCIIAIRVPSILIKTEVLS